MSLPIYRKAFSRGDVIPHLRAMQYKGEHTCMTMDELDDSTERQCGAPAAWEVEWEETEGMAAWLYCCERCFADSWRRTFIAGEALRIRILGCVQCGKPAEHCVIMLADGDVVIDEPPDGPCSVEATQYAPVCQACLDVIYARAQEDEDSEKGTSNCLDVEIVNYKPAEDKD